MYAAVQSVRISHRRIAYYELHPGRNRDADAESQHYHQTAAVNSFASTEYGIRSCSFMGESAPRPRFPQLWRHYRRQGQKSKKELELNE